MRYSLRNTLLTLVFVTLSAQPLHAQTFTSLNGPRGADWSPILVEPNGTLYMQIFYNAYESTDHGDHWRQIQSHEQHRVDFTNDAYGHIFGTDSVYGLVRSSDGGRMWQPLNDTKGWDFGWYAVSKRAILSLADSFPASGGVFYKTFISTDRGDHFTTYATPSSFNSLYQFVTADSNDNFYLSQTFGGFWRSTDNGVTWLAIPQLAPAAKYVTGFVTGSRGSIYARVSDDASNCFVVRSDNNGITWQNPVPIPVRFSVGSFDVLGNDTLLMDNLPGFEGDTVNPRMLRSVDGGKSWKQLDPVLPGISYGLIAGGGYDPKSGYYYLDFFGTGHWRSRDLGDTFESIDNGINQSNIQDLIRSRSGTLLAMSDYQIASRYVNGVWTPVSSTLIPVGVSSTGAGMTSLRNGAILSCVHGAIYLSTDDGQTWQKQFGRFDPKVVKSDYGTTVTATKLYCDSSLNVYATLTESTNLPVKQLVRSTDLGVSWTDFSPNGDTSIGAFAISPQQNLYAGGRSNLYVSSNGGTTWNTILRTSHRIASITISNESTILLGIDSESVTLTTDKGAHWSQIFSLPTNGILTQVSAPTGGIAIGTPLFVTIQQNTSDHSIEATYYPYAKWTGYITTDLGQHWTTLPDTIGVRTVWLDSPTKAELGTWNNGVVEMTITTKGVAFTPVNDQITIAPNPSNGKFQIQLSNASTRDLHISIFDERGALVREIDHARAEDGKLALDLSGAPAGHYEVRITSGAEVIVKNLVVVR